MRPPENWQDFESLCKKLFGEVWGCPNTIKKNGRSGQAQHGIDIYGKPKGENHYFGIQCKGKDNYKDSKVTIDEIDREIKNALTFQPKLHTIIFATTALKDVKIEEYIRQRDVDSVLNGQFEIYLYCWEDLADLIEENKDTYHWYMHSSGQKSSFEFEVEILDVDDKLVLKPKFRKIITEKLLGTYDQKYSHLLVPASSLLQTALLNVPSLTNPEINHGWCKLNLWIKNSGNVVLEDWKVWLEFSAEQVRELDDDRPKGWLVTGEMHKYRTSFANSEDARILCKPLNNQPLIQKDQKCFEFYVLPHFVAKQLEVKVCFLARDFSQDKDLTLPIEPEYEKVRKLKVVLDSKDEGVNEEITDYITRG